MGEYFIKLTIPANTPSDKPAETTIQVEGEILKEIAYLIPPGWYALAHFALFYGIKQVYPELEGQWMTGNDQFRVVHLNWKLPEYPCKLTVKGYNEDDTYEHKLYISLLTVERVEEARPWQLLADFVKSFKRLVGI